MFAEQPARLAVAEVVQSPVDGVPDPKAALPVFHQALRARLGL